METKRQRAFPRWEMPAAFKTLADFFKHQDAKTPS
jgi:hypothetical protein